MFTDAHLPGEFAKDVICSGVGGLKMLKDLSEVIGRCELGDRKLFANADVIPVAVIFGEIANGFVRIEEDILVPVIADALDLDGAALKADDFVIHAAKFAARAQRNQRPVTSGNGLKFLKNLKIRVLGVEDGMATLANYGFGVPQGTKNDCRAALRTVQGLRLRFRRT